MVKSLFDGRQISVGNISLRLSEETFIRSGGEAEVHRINDSNAVKIYKDIERAEKLKDKLTILCEKAPSFYESVVAPKELAYFADNVSQTICGFSMSFVPNAQNLEGYVWNDEIEQGEEAKFDQSTANLLYDLATGLKAIHKSYVVVGDLKPENILVSKGKAFIIDFDSTSLIPDFPGDTYTDFYIDPRLRGDTPDKPVVYNFDCEADWWSLGVIAFEMFFGISPWGGTHPKFRSDKIQRACNYSVVGFDGAVRAINMRPFDWLDDKPRLREFFENLFSPDPTFRYSIEYALDWYFQRPVAKRAVYSIPTRIEASRKSTLPALTFSNELLDFTENVRISIKEKGRTIKIRRRDEPLSSDLFLEYMLGVR